jgi:hypothetical protein
MHQGSEKKKRFPTVEAKLAKGVLVATRREERSEDVLFPKGFHVTQ